jgi:hypothetical protein
MLARHSGLNEGKEFSGPVLIQLALTKAEI